LPDAPVLDWPTLDNSESDLLFWAEFLNPRPRFAVPSAGRYAIVINQNYPFVRSGARRPIFYSLASERVPGAAFPGTQAGARIVSVDSGWVDGVLGYGRASAMYRVFLRAGESVRVEVPPESNDLYRPVSLRVRRLGAGLPTWYDADRIYMYNASRYSPLYQTIFAPVDAWYVLRFERANPEQDQVGLVYSIRFRLVPGQVRPPIVERYTESTPLVLTLGEPARAVWAEETGLPVWIAADLEPGRVYFIDGGSAMSDPDVRYDERWPKAVASADAVVNDNGLVAVRRATRVLFRGTLARTAYEFKLAATDTPVFDLDHSTRAEAIELIANAPAVEAPSPNFPMTRYFAATIPARSLGTIVWSIAGDCYSSTSFDAVDRPASALVAWGEDRSATTGLFERAIANVSDEPARVIFSFDGDVRRYVPDPSPCVRTMALRTEPLPNFNALALTPAPATDIEIGARYSGYLPDSPGRTVPYAQRGTVYLRAGRRYEFDLERAAQDFSGSLVLSDEVGVVVARSSYGVFGVMARCVVVPPRDGVYTVSIGAIEPSGYASGFDTDPAIYIASGPFVFTSREVGPGLDDAPDTVESTARLWSWNQPFVGQLDHALDADCYRVLLPQAGRFRLSVQAPINVSVYATAYSSVSLPRNFELVWAGASSPRVFATLGPSQYTICVRRGSLDWGAPADAAIAYSVRIEQLPIADVVGLGGVRGPDGQVTSDDLIAFLNAFFKLDTSLADVAQVGGVPVPDGWLTGDDIVAFVQAFMLGQ
jgi:hypothetical protein